MTHLIDPVTLTLDIDGWRPAVQAEPLSPRDWGLAVHQDPWTLFWAGAEAPHAHWCVSDTVSGRLIAIERTRAGAVCTAVRRLRERASALGLDIPSLLADLRRPFIH